eukprot:5715303-Pyramimonas_sp.AAC.1
MALGKATDYEYEGASEETNHFRRFSMLRDTLCNDEKISELYAEWERCLAYPCQEQRISEMLSTLKPLGSLEQLDASRIAAIAQDIGTSDPIFTRVFGLIPDVLASTRPGATATIETGILALTAARCKVACDASNAGDEATAGACLTTFYEAARTCLRKCGLFDSFKTKLAQHVASVSDIHAATATSQRLHSLNRVCETAMDTLNNGRSLSQDEWVSLDKALTEANGLCLKDSDSDSAVEALVKLFVAKILQPHDAWEDLSNHSMVLLTRLVKVLPASKRPDYSIDLLDLAVRVAEIHAAGTTYMGLGATDKDRLSAENGPTK